MNATGMNELERIRLAQAVALHRLHNYVVIQLPDDCHQDDINRLEADAQIKFPLNGLICRSYSTLPVVERVPNPKATWKLAPND